MSNHIGKECQAQPERVANHAQLSGWLDSLGFGIAAYCTCAILFDHGEAAMFDLRKQRENELS